MDPEIKKKWIEALRSGKYSQTKEYLRDNNGYCCLGVLCDIVDPDDWFKQDDGPSYWFGVSNRKKSNTGLISEVIDKAFPDYSSTKVSSIEDHLIDMNDTQSKNFLEIADFIEKEL